MPVRPVDDHFIETYKSLITLSIEVFKFCALANGGAAVALLAYLGNVAGKSFPVPDMRVPMAFFLTGLACCGVAMFFAYLTQLFLLNERIRSEEETPLHHWYLRFGMLGVLISLVAFILGSWQAVIAFPIKA